MARENHNIETHIHRDMMVVFHELYAQRISQGELLSTEIAWKEAQKYLQAAVDRGELDLTPEGVARVASLLASYKVESVDK